MPSHLSPASFNAWRQLPRSLTYPLTFEPVLFIVLGSTLIWVFSTSLFGLPIVLSASIGLAQFLLLNLRHAALGGEESPAITVGSFTQLGATPIKLLLVIFAWASLAAELGTHFSHVGMAMTLTGFLFLPAFTVLLALEESLHYALNPVRLVKLVLHGGSIYLLFAAGLGLLSQQVRIDVDAARLIFSLPPTGMLFYLMAGMYIATAASYMLGRIAYAAHDFRPPEGHNVNEPRAKDADSPDNVAESLDALLKAADRETVLHAWKRHDTHDTAFQLALLDGLRKQRAWPLVPWQAQRTVTLLLQNNRGMDALRTALHTLTTHATFATVSAKEWLALCRVADESHRCDWLQLLAEKACERFPDDPVLFDIALLHARHVALKRNDVHGALALIEPFLERSDHPRHAELLAFRKALSEMAGA